MHRRVRNRLLISFITMVIIGSGIYISLYFLSENIVFFVTPSEISDQHFNKKIRLGGLVEKGSVKKLDVSETMFKLTDGRGVFLVRYKGILPTLFRETQGIVAEGYIRGDVLVASRLLTKHDENYKPPKNEK